jgi:phosphatidylglycerol:prolipoprotein diacylglycerol transferase
VGCFAAGCCYGKPTHHFWGVTFTNPIANLNSYTPLGIPLEPTQLFEAAVELANFFILMWLFRRKKFDGQVLAAYFILYGVAR